MKEGRGRVLSVEPCRAATTGCAYFMVATYHKCISLIGRAVVYPHRLQGNNMENTAYIQKYVAPSPSRSSSGH